MSYKAKNEGIIAVLLIIIGFVASGATTFMILWPFHHGISSGNKGVDLYIFLCGSLIVFQTLVGLLRYIFTRNSGIDVPYLIYIWIIFLIVSGIGILLARLGVPIPEKEKTLYVMMGASVLLGIAGYIVTCLIQKKQNDKRYDKLKAEIEKNKKDRQ